MEASSVTNHSMVPQLLEDGNYETWSSFMEDYLLGQDLWDVVTQPKPDENTAIASSNSKSWKNIIKRWRRNNALAVHAIKMSCGPKFLPLVLKSKSSKEAWDLLASAANSNCKAEEDEERTNENETDYSPFIKAIQEHDLRAMEMFVVHHPEALRARVFTGGKTALHHALFNMKIQIAKWLVERMTASDLEILDGGGCTALARAAELKDFLGVSDLLELMVMKNLGLSGEHGCVSVIVACWRGDEDEVRHVYKDMDKNVFSPERDSMGINFLMLCINMQIFDIAADLVRKFCDLLHQNLNGVNPIQALAKHQDSYPPDITAILVGQYLKSQISDVATKMLSLSLVRERVQHSGHKKQIHNHYHDFLKLVCAKVSDFEIDKLRESVYPAIIDATKHGNVKFINEMIGADPRLLNARDDKDKSMFWHAVQNRQEKIFCLISKAVDFEDFLPPDYDYDTGNNILHFVAMLPPPDVLHRFSSNPVLQLHREALWFKELCSLANAGQKEALNKDGLTPCQLFSRSHADMIAVGEMSIKNIASSFTVVSALIVTIMYAAAFTVPGGYNQETGYPIFADKTLFKLFFLCDGLSLAFSAYSIFVFLDILIYQHVEKDYLSYLPQRLESGVGTLFLSTTSMMMTFCLALALILNGRLQLILTIAIYTSLPVYLYAKSMNPLVSKINLPLFVWKPELWSRNRKQTGEETMNGGMV